MNDWKLIYQIGHNMQPRVKNSILFVDWRSWVSPDWHRVKRQWRLRVRSWLPIGWLWNRPVKNDFNSFQPASNLINERQTLFSSCGKAPASNSILTTSAWPPSAAKWSGVDSPVRLREAVTTDKSNFISCWSTATDPCMAAMWAQVFPSCWINRNFQDEIDFIKLQFIQFWLTLLADDTRAGWCFKNSRTTSEWFVWAAKWMALRPNSSAASVSAPSSTKRLHTSSWPAPAANWRAVSFRLTESGILILRTCIKNSKDQVYQSQSVDCGVMDDYQWPDKLREAFQSGQVNRSETNTRLAVDKSVVGKKSVTNSSVAAFGS